MLQNRVTPDARLVAEDWHGDMMGNRGGKIHDPHTRTLLTRRWASKRWIICVLNFKDRRRSVMGDSYTELFFLDEVSALASGHRPCFECRRDAANTFAAAWAKSHGNSWQAKADDIDVCLHQQRIGENPIQTSADIKHLPNGSMIMDETETMYAKQNGGFLRWSGKGYVRRENPQGRCVLLTPPSTVRVLQEGYLPLWHSSASELNSN